MRDFLQLSVAPGGCRPGQPAGRAAKNPLDFCGLAGCASCAPGPRSRVPIAANAAPNWRRLRRGADLAAALPCAAPSRRRRRSNRKQKHDLRPCAGAVCGRPCRPWQGPTGRSPTMRARARAGANADAAGARQPAPLQAWARQAYARSASCSLRPGTLPIKSRLPSSTPL